MTIIEAIPDERYPAVLVRAIAAEGDHVVIERAAPGGEWLPVRSGFPARVVGSEAIAYDLEVEPGARYSYRVTGPDVTDAAVGVVDVPVVAGPLGRSGWLKPVWAPSLTMPLPLAPVGDIGREDRWESVRGQGGADFTRWSAPGPDEWSVAAHYWSEADARACRAALASGPVLVQTDSARHGLWRSSYGLARGVSVKQYADLEVYTVSWTLTACPRPWPGGARVVIPGWDWGRAREGAASLSQVAARYPTRWDLLLAGTRAARSA